MTRGGSMTTIPERRESTVHCEAVVRPPGRASMFAESSAVQAARLDDLRPPPARAAQAALALQRRGFIVRHIGTFSISAEGPRRLWEETFNTRVEARPHSLRG